VKLFNFASDAFGCLTGKWSFAGKSSVLFGKNEKGKTTFIDALLCAMFGAPKGTAAQAHIKLFRDRYGAGPYSVQAGLRTAEGEKVASSSSAPGGEKCVQPLLFRNLLVIHRGECGISETSLKDRSNKGFLESFTEQVLGGGSVNVNKALQEIERVFTGSRARKTKEIASALEDDVRKLEGQLESARSLRGRAREKDKLAQKIAGLKPEAEKLDEEAGDISRARYYYEEEDLRKLRGRLEEARRAAQGAEVPGEELLKKLEGLEKDAAAARSKSRTCREVSERVRLEIKEFAEELEKKKKALEGLADDVVRTRLTKAIDELKVREAAAAQAEKSGGMPKAWRLPVAAVIGAAAAFAVYAGSDNAVFAALAGAAAAIIWGIAGGGGEAGGEAKRAVESARREYDAVIERLGAEWKDLDFVDAGAKLDEQKACEVRVASGIADMKKMMEKKRGGLDEETEKARSFEDEAKRREEDVAAQLKKWGADTLEALKDKRRHASAARDKFKERSDEARRKLEKPDAPDAELAELLGTRLLDLKDKTKELALTWKELSREDLELRRTENERRQAKLKENREEYNRDLLRMTEAVAVQETELGSPAGTLFARLQGKKLARENFEHWREAAEDARAVIEDLSSRTDAGMKRCVQAAAPLYKAMTEELYGDIEIVKDSIFQEDALKVRHASLGRQPLAWLSSGARDLLWLAMRFALAKRVFPQGGLLLLDEPFLTLDMERTRKAAATLFAPETMPGWQIIVLTKDERVADICAAAGAARHPLA